MQNRKIEIPIEGMHCTACELLLEEKLGAVEGVSNVKVNHKSGMAEVFYSGEEKTFKKAKLLQAVKAAGYAVSKEDARKNRALLTLNFEIYKQVLFSVLILLGLIWLAKALGFEQIGAIAPSDPKSLSAVVLVGLVAGFSTCMALLGGLVLSFSGQKSKQEKAVRFWEKMRPQILFNGGRIGGYFVLGGLLGYFGNLFQFSTSATAFLMVLVGGVMLFLGLKLTGIFPILDSRSIALPKFFGKVLGLNDSRKKHGPIILGVLTFFLPCGFTQAMQVYALGSGSFLAGGLIMAAFALGTLPGLLGIGGLASFFQSKKSAWLFRFVGVAVVLLALFNISNGLNLGGWRKTVQIPTSNLKSNLPPIDQNVQLKDGVQVVKMTQKVNGYAPNKFTIKKGVPVRWVIESETSNSCAASLVMSKIGISKQLKKGENVIEFTPTESGVLPFSCSMGMYTGSFVVVDGNSNADIGSSGGYNGNNLAEPRSSGAGCQMTQAGGTCPNSASCTSSNISCH